MKDKNLVVVVLGNRLNDDGTITKIQEERLEMALEIEKLFKPNYYILTGGPANPVPNKTEAEAMYDYLIDRGIEKERLIKEMNSYSTVENALYSAPIIKELKADVCMICTSSYHLANPIHKAMESFTKELKNTNIVLMTYTRP